ncbi:MAG: GFA family protein [Myxococcota bacterium]
MRFRVTLGARGSSVVCNCSVCHAKGFVHLIVEREAFALLQGEERLTEYRFGTGTARHLFCSVCGVHPFYVPRSHPDGVDVNVRCLDGDLHTWLQRLPPTPFDGRHWEENVGSLREDG